MSQLSKIKSTEHLTHDVLRIVAEKPKNLQFKSGQAVDVSINKEGWENVLRPFTFTSLPEESDIEFTIKTYPSRQGVTNELLSLKTGDELIVGEVFGDISFKGDGIFIAGGAGVTPFISIFKNLEKNNQLDNSKLIFANKTKADIILEDKFFEMLGDRFVNVLSEDEIEGYEHGYITQELLKKHTAELLPYYYLCGPPPMMEAIEKHLEALGVTKEFIVREAF